MIITNKTLVKINASNYSHYIKFYNDIKCNDVIEVDINNLNNFSKSIIEVKCDSCSISKEITYKNYKSYGYINGEYYCRECKKKRNLLEKYGVENVFQLDEVKNKSKKAVKNKYGVDNISQSIDIKNKIKSNNIEKYGVDHHFKKDDILNKMLLSVRNKYGVDNISQLDDVKEKKVDSCILSTDEFRINLKEHNLEKYGVENYFESDDAKEKIRNSNIEKYGVDIASKSEIVKSKIKRSVTNKLHNKILNENNNIVEVDSDNKIFKMMCNDCNSTFDITYSLFYKRRETSTVICTNCNEVDKHQSGLEVMLFNFIKSNYDRDIIQNYKIDKKEIDIYLPELKLGFEFNGIYWHSDLYKSKLFHKEKTDICNSNNIQLIHIWEDDWLYKQDIVKSMVLNKIGYTSRKIYARRCEIREVSDLNITRDFLDKNHIQGNVNSSIKIGLYYNSELVSLMCFKKSGIEYDLNRFCSLLGVIVIGGASKMLKYFVDNHSGNITTFSNNTYSDGSVYEKIGFEKVYEIGPDYSYVVDGIRVHKFNFRGKETKDLIKIYDSGKVKYKYKKCDFS